MEEKKFLRIAEILLQSIEDLHEKNQQPNTTADYDSLVALALAFCVVDLTL